MFLSICVFGSISAKLGYKSGYYNTTLVVKKRDSPGKFSIPVVGLLASHGGDGELQDHHALQILRIKFNELRSPVLGHDHLQSLLLTSKQTSWF